MYIFIGIKLLTIFYVFHLISFRYGVHNEVLCVYIYIYIN